MEPTVTLDLTQYEELKERIDQLQKLRDSKWAIKVKNYNSHSTSEMWTFYSNTDSVPDIIENMSKQITNLEKSLEACKKEAYNLKVVYIKEIDKLNKHIAKLENKKPFWKIL